jgi:hypothetical protein
MAAAGDGGDAEAVDDFWRALEQRFSSLGEAFKVFAQNGDRVSLTQFEEASEQLCGAQMTARARHLVFSSLRRGHGEEWFGEGDMVREHSGWRKRTQTLQRSAMDSETVVLGPTRDGRPVAGRGSSSAIIIPEPDALAKANDVRLPHQLLTRPDSRRPAGKNEKWYYPQPSPEMEARRVIDFWRGVAARPWGSKQEAAQHFRRAFAFFDTTGCGRVNLDAFKAGLVRLRYGLTDALARRLFDTIDRRKACILTHADIAAPLYLPQGGGQPWESGAPAPKAWLRHNRLASFDTSRLPMREHLVRASNTLATH